MILNFRHLYSSAVRIDDADPFANEIEQDVSLGRCESVRADTFRLNDLTVVTRAGDDVRHFIIQSCLLLLRRAQGMHQGKSFVVLITEGPDRPAVKRIHRGLGSGVAW